MKRTTLFGALAALVLAGVPVFAQDASSDFDAPAPSSETATPAATLGTLKWAGDQAFTWRQGAYDPATRTGGSVESKLSAEYKFEDLKVVGAALVRDNEFVPGETAVYWAPGTLRFGLGWQEFSWGVADANNPTDTLNARDYRYGAKAARLVNPAATAAWYPTEWVSLEAVYEPWKEVSRFPSDFAANTQGGLTKLKNTLAGYGVSGYNPTVTGFSLDQNLANPVYGGRANFFLAGLDLSVSYLNDFDTFYTPVITPGVHTFNVPDSVTLVRNRVQRFGLNAKTTVDAFGLWLEAAYNKTAANDTNDVTNRHDSLVWTSGLDVSFGPASAYYLNLQYAGSWVAGYDGKTVADYPDSALATTLGSQASMLRYFYRSLTQSLGSQSEEWLHGATFSLKFPLADATVTPSLSGAVMVPMGYDTTNATRLASGFFKPEVDWVPVDGIHVLVGADLAYGWVKKAGSSDITLETANDKLGVYTPQNNVYVQVKYSWNGSL